MKITRAEVAELLDADDFDDARILREIAKENGIPLEQLLASFGREIVKGKIRFTAKERAIALDLLAPPKRCRKPSSAKSRKR